MEKFNITIENTGESFFAIEDASILEAMEQSSCRGIPVGCRNGGCGACKIRIIEGLYETRKMNRAVISKDEELDSCVLACRTYPRGEIKLVVLGRAWAPDPDCNKMGGFSI